MIRLFGWFTDRHFGAYQQAWMEKYSEEVENMYQEMRAFRHNYKNHLQVMKAHLDLGEYQELSDVPPDEGSSVVHCRLPEDDGDAGPFWPCWGRSTGRHRQGAGNHIFPCVLLLSRCRGGDIAGH